MFNFMKKGVGVGERDREKTDRDKDRRKKEKKQRKDINKQNLSGTMSSEELLRLDEVRVLMAVFAKQKTTQFYCESHCELVVEFRKVYLLIYSGGAGGIRQVISSNPK